MDSADLSASTVNDGPERCARGRAVIESDAQADTLAWMPLSLRERLDAAVQSPILLVACDYDGTLAPIVVNAALAHGDRSALAAFDDIGLTNWTEIAVISGRGIAELRGFLGSVMPGWVVGSHGAEWQSGGVELSDAQRKLLASAREVVTGVAGGFSGTRVELKPAGVALHTRGMSEDRAGEAVAQAESACSRLEGLHVRRGSGVVEFMVVAANKGDALKRVRHACGATTVIFVGDDATDEDVFRTVSADDVTVKVGEGETAARYRVADVSDVGRLLRFVADRRAEWARGRNLPELARCAILSDQRTAVVISPGAKISWMCLPRLDSAAVFASLVGDDSAGIFEVHPVETIGRPRVSYDGDSFICVTEWDGLRVTDYLDCSGGRAFQKAGRSDLFRVIEASAPARVRFAPRLDYGRIPTHIAIRSDGLEVQGSNDPIVLRSPGIAWTIVDEGVHQTAVAEIAPSGRAVVLELRYGTSNIAPAIESESNRREQNRRFWSGWAGSLRLPMRYAPLVKRSALVLKALSYGPSGAIAAAATTSLPEQMGGVRNWDYRYCWPRDAAKAAASLVRLGNTGHAMKLLDWLLEVVDRCETPDRLHPIYSLSGGLLPPEAELGHLGGFGQSRPVRIGNAAANQVQLDVFGPIVNLVAMLAERGAPIAPDHWRLVRAMVRAVESRWREPDHGIWEMRIERRHHVHSKVMCWHTVDRALVVEQAVSGTRNPEWTQLASQIREDVLSKGWNEHAGAFTGAYGHGYLDAGALKIGLTGLIEPSDPRWIATVEKIDRTLRRGPTVRRYDIDDGLPGTEGGMHICTGWLIKSLISIGRLDAATELLDLFASAFAGPGILSEQYGPQHRMPIGNLAQAYSHLAFIDAVVAMESAQQ